MIQAGHVYVLRDQGCVCAFDFRGECGEATRAPRRPRTGRRARTGPVDVERPAGAPYYNVTMNGYSGGTAAGGPILGPGAGATDFSDGHAAAAGEAETR